MEKDRAKEIANELLSLEGVVGDTFAEREADLRAVSDSMRAVLPDFETWAVVGLIELPSQESRPFVLALEEGVVWKVGLERRDGVPFVLTKPEPSDRWRVHSVGDGIVSDGTTGARVIQRGWVLDLGGELWAFATEHHVLTNPNPDRAERLGRALAAVQGWEVGDIPPDDEPHP